MNKRRNYSAVFKTKVALDAIKGDLTLPELSSKYNVNPKIISKWKVEAVKNLQGVFEGHVQTTEKKDKSETAYLYKKIGELQVQLDFLKESSGL
jgi:transposase